MNNLYSSPNIITVITSRRMRWAGHVARIGIGVMRIKLMSENLMERDQSEDPHVDDRIILKWTLKKQCGRVWNGFIWLRIVIAGGLL
jgi:hypothetical protein